MKTDKTPTRRRSARDLAKRVVLPPTQPGLRHTLRSAIAVELEAGHEPEAVLTSYGAKIPPSAPVRLVRPRRRGCAYTWEVIRCPYCGKTHRHGAGEIRDQVSRFLGHRVAHCDRPGPDNLGYILTPAMEL